MSKRTLRLIGIAFIVSGVCWVIRSVFDMDTVIICFITGYLTEKLA